MAAADTARLVAQLTLDAKGFTQGAQKAGRALGGLEGSIGNIGRKAGQGLATFTKNVGLIGVAATGVIAVAVKGGLQDLATLESAITSVDGAIDQMGQTGQVTGKQVADWANDIERNIDAAFDDKDITNAAATLIRFGKVVPKNLKDALEVTADLAVRTGDVESASELLAKALADPTKAAGKLARAGIILTKEQQKTIKAMLEQNDVAGAQKLILDEVAKTTEGAAAASQGKYADALNKLNDIAEDARKALAEGFLPVIERVADLLGKGLADPKVMAGLREFGVTLASGLDDLISVATRLPWGTIGESLRIAGMGAKAVLDAFTSLPPWIQTAVLTGWGLNKLTGGALTGIGAEIFKGLGGSLFSRGASPANPLWVASAQGGVGGPGAPVGATGGALRSAASAAVKVVLPVGLGLVIGGEIARALGANVSDDPIQNIETLLKTYVVNDTDNDQKIQGSLKEGRAEQRTASAKAQQAAFAVRDATAQGAEKNRQAAAAVRDAVNTKVGFLASVTEGVRSAVNSTTAAARAAGQQAAFAIRDKDLSVDVTNAVTVNTSVSVRETSKTQTTYKQFSRYIS